MFINLQYRNARGLIRSSKPDSASTPIIDLVCCSYDSYKSHSESKLKGDGIRLYFRFKGNQSSVEAMAKRENVRAKLFIFRYTSFPWLLSMHFFLRGIRQQRTNKQCCTEGSESVTAPFYQISFRLFASSSACASRKSFYSADFRQFYN